jgi:hypothetical protein
MTSTSCFVLYQLHGIATLNNHGIVLMKHEKYLDAKETFQDALTVVKQTVNTFDTITAGHENLIAEEIAATAKYLDDKIQLAQNRVYRINQRHHDDRNDVTCLVPNILSLSVRVLNYSLTSGFEHDPSETNQLASMGQIFLFRIEVNELVENDLTIFESILDIKTAMILFNMGVANMFTACNDLSSFSAEGTMMTSSRNDMKRFLFDRNIC